MRRIPGSAIGWPVIVTVVAVSFFRLTGVSTPDPPPRPSIAIPLPPARALPPRLNVAAPPKTPPRSRQAATRREVFAAATGIHSARLARLYESADLDGNGRLSVPELRAFQHALVSECAYLHNESALRPDEFLAAGGGDCDDWALMTAGLLRYWGVPAWLGILKGQSDEGHAICLVRMIDPPADFVAFVLSEDSVRHGVTVPAGRYIPVDYEHVGDFSPASGPDPMLVDLFVPESAYGLPM